MSKRAFHAWFSATDKATGKDMGGGLCSGPVSTRALAQRICDAEHERTIEWEKRCGGSTFNHAYTVVERHLTCDEYWDNVYDAAWFATRRDTP